MGLRGQKPKGAVKIIWSPSFAYVIGLIATDGCLYNDKRHISFVSKDRDLVETFKSVLGLKVKIGIKLSAPRRDRTPHVQFGDVLFYKFLENIGLTQAKSLTLGSLRIPEEFFFDFLRGCLDGDGCSYSYWDPRWKSSFMFYVSFASGSIKFVSWLQSTIVKLSNLKGRISVHWKKDGKNPYYQLRYSKYEAIKLVRLMYANKKCIKLSRKYLKIKKSLDIVRKHKGRVFVR